MRYLCTGGTGSTVVNASDIGVCVKPIHFDYDKTLEIIEFIELNKILGVTKFTFYNHTMSEGKNTFSLYQGTSKPIYNNDFCGIFQK